MSAERLLWARLKQLGRTRVHLTSLSTISKLLDYNVKGNWSFIVPFGFIEIQNVVYESPVIELISEIAMKSTYFLRARWLLRTLPMILVICVGVVHVACAQGRSASSSANASAKVIQGIQITKTSDLHFGALIPSTGGTVTVAVSGGRTYTGYMTMLSSSSFPVAAANFTLMGAPTQAYTVTLPTTAILTRQGGSDTLLVGSFTSSPFASGTLDTNGNGSLAVGGTLTIPGSQTPGYYAGQFTVTLSYQ
jgi:hypothetical protein